MINLLQINLLLERLTDLNITKIEMIDDKETLKMFLFNTDNIS